MPSPPSLFQQGMVALRGDHQRDGVRSQPLGLGARWWLTALELDKSYGVAATSSRTRNRSALIGRSYSARLRNRLQAGDSASNAFDLDLR